MNDKGNNVIPFPTKAVEKRSQEQYDLETTHYIINAVTEELEDLGYDIDTDQRKKDMTVLANLLYASFQRDHEFNEHIFHFVLDECHNMVEEAKQYMRQLEQQDDELDNEDPSNDNRRL